MEPIATYDEILAMDEATFVKTFKEKQLEQALIEKNAKAASVVISTRDAELAKFDEETKVQISKLEVTRSMERTVIEKKYLPIVSEPIVKEEILVGM